MSDLNIKDKLANLLTHQTSKRRAVILTILMISLYFVLYILIKRGFYSLVKVGDYTFIKEKYFFTFYCISTLPIFFFLFFKFNICTNFWTKTNTPNFMDYIYFTLICLFLFLSFNNIDISITAVQGNSLLEMVSRGMNILDFYDYNQGQASYLLPYYILFGIWSIPVKFIYMIIGLKPIDNNISEAIRIIGFTLWWYKLLPTLFYICSTLVINKICIHLNFDKNKAQWISFIFFIFPMGTFSQFIFGQYDSIGIFFELIMIYYFLERKVLKASIFCMIAITFKTFPVFIYIPILLLFEKKIWKIIGYTGIVFSAWLFFNLLFMGSSVGDSFESGFRDRLLAVGVNTYFGVVSFLVLIFVFSCVFAYFINIKSKDELTIKKYIMYIPLFIYSSFFSFVLFHPQWILILVPYLVINIFLNKNTKYMMFITIGASIGFLFTVFSVPNWFQNVDACMINLGIFPKIYGFYNGIEANLVNSGIWPTIYGFAGNGEGFKSLNRIVSFSGLIPYNVYFTLFVGMLFANLILSFPNEKNILKNKDTIQLPFKAGRDVVWINGLIVLLFTIPSLLLFYSQSPK
jgi:hypothetical protein